MPGRFLEEDIEEVRRRSDLVEVVTGFLQLKKAGRVYKGLCCFHQEKTPSFSVDPDKQLFHCFGCGAGGDIFTFIRQTEGLSFTEAVERQATRTGVSLRTSGGARSDGGTRKALLEANRIAAAYFADLLLNSGEATGARRYIERRGFTMEEAAAWGLGFSPSGRDVLFRRLVAEKLTPAHVVDAGLAMVGDGGAHRDRFHGRLMFPVWDLSGDVVGFGARALGDETPKYLNSPETLLYKKARILYGLNRARAEMVQRAQAVIAEGYTDVIGLHRAGVRNAVATCGTALSEEHLGLIKRFCDRVILAFDADAAGAMASERGFGGHARFGLEVLVAEFPSGKDPADLAVAEGPEAVNAILDGAVPLMRFVLEADLARRRLDTPEAKGAAAREAARLLATEQNRVARSEHAFWLGRRLGVDPQQVMLEISQVEGPGAGGPGPGPAPKLSGQIRLEREALTYLLTFPNEVAGAEWLDDDHFTDPRHKVILAAMRAAPPGSEAGSVMDHLPDDDARRLAAELALATVATEEPGEIFERLEEQRIVRKIQSLKATLNQIDQDSDASERDALFGELMALEEQRRRFEEP